jgi:glycosyltransferase involved in cell wall biosynthesis
MTFPNYDVTVVVPTYNRSKLLSYTLNSLARQQLAQITMEVIVVDDGSNDDSYQIVEKYSKLLNLKYYFQEDKGYRVASARNIGISQASGEVIIFIDSGVIVGSRTIESHWCFHNAKQQPVAVIGYVYGFDQNDDAALKLIASIDLDSPDDSILQFNERKEHLDIREPSYQMYEDKIELLPAPWVFFWTCNVSVRKASLLAVGNFDEKFNYRWGVEDQDIGLRLYKNGVNIYLNREAVSIHYPHYKNEEANKTQDMQNRKYFHEKHRLRETKIYLSCDDFELNEILKSEHSFHS